MAFEEQFKEWILDSIDQLRRRKARPGVERICHMVERRYGVSAAHTQMALDKLVDAEDVIKVDYKGNTSYRNAAKWGRKNALNGHGLNSSDVTRTLVAAVRHLETASNEQTISLQPTSTSEPICNERTNSRELKIKNEQTIASTDDDRSRSRGVSTEDIENYLLLVNSQTTLVQQRLQVALEREVFSHQLKKLPNGKYLVFDNKKYSLVVNDSETVNPKKGTKKACIKSKLLVESHHDSPKVVLHVKKGRSPNKRKRFKKTHGPDFVENYDSYFEEPEAKCDYCLLTTASNCNGEPEDLLFCKECNAKAHPTCMDYSADLALRSRMSPWQCIDCKTCYVCDDSGNADAMLFCDSCDKGYHMNCHVPPVKLKPVGKWICCQCDVNTHQALSCQNMAVKIEKMEYEREQSDSDGAAGTPAVCISSHNEGEQAKKNFNCFVVKSEANKENNEIPDASEWTIEDVANYFRKAGFPEQAHAFREQEIDGRSLLLLKRSDVLTGLSIKLGPALKIYNHVKRLQTRRADGHLIC